MIRLIAVDIDGTLLDSRGRVPAANREALEHAAGRGIVVALVTGRSFHFTQPIAQALGLPLTLVLNNGAVVKDAAGRTLMRRPLPRAAALDVLTGTRRFEDSVAVVFDREPGDGLERQIVFERMDWSHPNRRGYYEKNKAFIAPAVSLAEAVTEDPLQVMFNGSVEAMRQLVTALRGMAGSIHFSVAITEYEQRDFSLVDVNGAGCSKGTTLERWTASLGITREQVMAVGDNLNDVDMLEFAGIGVVMANAAAALKTRGFHLTPTNDENGLAIAIEKFAFGVE